MAQRMVDLWTSFVIDGVPKASDVKEWPKMSGKSSDFIIFDGRKTRLSYFFFSAFNGPYLKINREPMVAEDYTDEFSVCSREKNGPKLI